MERRCGRPRLLYERVTYSDDRPPVPRNRGSLPLPAIPFPHVNVVIDTVLLTAFPCLRHHVGRTFHQISRKEAKLRARFLGKDADSQVDNSPTLFATDRTDRVTYIAQGWKVTDPQVLADVGPVPDHETLIEVPEDVLRMYVRRYQEQEGRS
jgi:hypothetical protein